MVPSHSLLSRLNAGPREDGVTTHHALQDTCAPLTLDEATRLAAACATYQERLMAWTRLDTSVRVSELARLTREQIGWHNHRLVIYSKDGISGTKSQRRIVAVPTEYVHH